MVASGYQKKLGFGFEHLNSGDLGPSWPLLFVGGICHFISNLHITPCGEENFGCAS